MDSEAVLGDLGGLLEIAEQLKDVLKKLDKELGDKEEQDAEATDPSN
jgi:hypothetical protein